MVAAPAAAQSAADGGTLGAGLSFLGDDGGTGVTVDFAKPIKSTISGRALELVGDVSFHRNSVDGFGSDANFTNMTAQAGLRVKGPAGEKVTWHAQVLAGLLRSSFDFEADDFAEELCDELDIDCGIGDSDTGFIVTPGVGINYWFSQRTALRAQLDLLINDDGSSTRFWVGISRSF